MFKMYPPSISPFLRTHRRDRLSCWGQQVKVVNNVPVTFQMAVLRNGILLLSRSEGIRTDFVENKGDLMEFVNQINNFISSMEKAKE